MDARLVNRGDIWPEGRCHSAKRQWGRRSDPTGTTDAVPPKRSGLLGDLRRLPGRSAGERRAGVLAVGLGDHPDGDLLRADRLALRLVAAGAEALAVRLLHQVRHPLVPLGLALGQV